MDLVSSRRLWSASASGEPSSVLSGVSMFIAYLSTDEVNRDLAETLAAAGGDALCLLEPRDLPRSEDGAALVYDLDSLPPGLCASLVADLRAVPPARPVAVHSYALEDEDVKA